MKVTATKEEGVILPSAARMVTGNSGDIIIESGTKLAVFLDITATAGTTPTLNVTVKAKDPASGKYFVIGTFAQKTAIANEAIFIGSGADTKFPTKIVRVEYVVGGTTPSFTFSVGYSAV